MYIITAINNNPELYPFLCIIEIKTDLNCRMILTKPVLKILFRNKHFTSLTRVYCCNTCYTIVAQGKELILLGDFDCCPMSSTRNNTDCQQLKSLFRYSDLKQLITSPTRISKDSKSLVDLIAASCPLNI